MTKFKTIKVKENVYNKLKMLSEEFSLSIPDILDRIVKDAELLPSDCKPWSSDIVYCYDSRHKLWTPCLRFGTKLYCYDIEKGTYIQKS